MSYGKVNKFQYEHENATLVTRVTTRDLEVARFIRSAIRAPLARRRGKENRRVRFGVNAERPCEIGDRCAQRCVIRATFVIVEHPQTINYTRAPMHSRGGTPYRGIIIKRANGLAERSDYDNPDGRENGRGREAALWLSRGEAMIKHPRGLARRINGSRSTLGRQPPAIPGPRSIRCRSQNVKRVPTRDGSEDTHRSARLGSARPASRYYSRGENLRNVNVDDRARLSMILVATKLKRVSSR